MQNFSQSAANKVRQLIKREQEKAEILISRIKLLMMLGFTVLYFACSWDFGSKWQFNPAIILLAGYFPSLVLQLILAQRRFLSKWTTSIFIILDFVMIGLLIYAYQDQNPYPGLMYVKSLTFIYFFLLITVQSLRFQSIFVVIPGISAVCTWLYLFGYALVGMDYRKSHALPEVMISGAFLDGLAPDKLIILILFTVIMAIGVKYGHNLKQRFNDYCALIETQTKRKNLQLHFEKEKAEEASRAKSRFLDIVSHELKTPLNAILGITQLQLLQNPDSDELKDLLEKGRILLSHVSRILRFAEIESRSLPLVTQSIQLKPFLEEAIRFYQSSAMETNNPIVCFLQDEIIGNFDKNKVVDILYELLSNADKNSLNKEIVLTAFYQEENGSRLLNIQVKDQGKGMTEEQIQLALDLFSQTHDSKTRKEGGIGLGLPMAMQLAASMDATIDISSIIGEGTVVRVRIPQN